MIMKSKLIVTLIIVINCFIANAQRYDWAKFCEGSNGGISVTHDHWGNLIMVGEYSEDLISGSDTLHPYFPGNGSDVYVAKFAYNGTLLWVRGFGGSWYDNVYSVTTDPVGNIYVTAYVQNPETYFGDTIVSNPSTKQLVKFNPYGDFKWNKYFSSQA